MRAARRSGAVAVILCSRLSLARAAIHAPPCAALAILLALSGEARADCAVAPSYGVTIAGNTVVICVSDLLCNAASPMLRQDAVSGALVRLAPYCSVETDVDAGADGGVADLPAGCYQDECVAPGTYHYGLESPLPCGGCGANAPYYIDATVTQALPSGCQVSAGNGGDIAYDAGTPWPAGASMESSCGGCSSASAPLFGLQAAVALASLAWMWKARSKLRDPRAGA